MEMVVNLLIVYHFTLILSGSKHSYFVDFNNASSPEQCDILLEHLWYNDEIKVQNNCRAVEIMKIKIGAERDFLWKIHL